MRRSAAQPLSQQAMFYSLECWIVDGGMMQVE